MGHAARTMKNRPHAGEERTLVDVVDVTTSGDRATAARTRIMPCVEYSLSLCAQSRLLV